MSGFSNKPKILRGAFVEYGLSVPPLFVVFQFNPDQLSRSRSLSFSAPNKDISGSEDGLRKFHKTNSLLVIQKNQQVTVNEETISFDLRLDATDSLDKGETTGHFGIAPELAALEMMAHPKEEVGVGAALGSLLRSDDGYSFTKKQNPPMVLFIWGIKRVLPVNINSLSISETEFSTWLNPVRAEISVSLSVIEGKNTPYTYSKVMQEAMALLNLSNITKMANVVIPG
ncbi:MAG: hypothetical protein KAW12_00020 [Candidatus Aminicenantes bacterium]|nr:hypothetical protein [Candidatus Aminicenantes bacterium]